MPQAEKMCSLWCATAEERAEGSSPAISSTPPCFAVPAWLAWRKTSPLRSTPGPLPYHIEKMPSNFGCGNRCSCCVPQIAVAAMSSLRPGWKVMSCCLRKGAALCRAKSSPPSGEPR
jgi:hypothetical protein